MFRGLSETCNRVINQLAPIEMKRLNHKVVQPEHILIALLKEGSEEVFPMLDEVIDLVHFQCILESHMVKMQDEQAISSKNILIYYNINVIPEISQRTKTVLLDAIDESRSYNHDNLDIFSLFVACCGDKQSIANVILMRHQLVLDDFRQYYVNYLKEKGQNQKSKSNSTYTVSSAEEFSLSLQKNLEKHGQSKGAQGTSSEKNTGKRHTDELSKYSVDLTKKSYAEKLSKIYGRNEEINKIFRIMLRRQKNNPLLIGDAGVGKTAIVEELARRISRGEAPLPLLEARILELNLTSLTAGTRYRGDFEERFLNIINDVIRLSKKQKVFLFIDEFHHIIGTGLANGLTMDAAGILKPALARGVVSCIGATTHEEYRKHIEMDKAFQRRLQTIEVNEMSEDGTVKALAQIKKEYESKHHVIYSDEAIQEIVHLSTNYFFDRKLPDKAIDLLDEIGSYISLQKVHPPQELKLLIKKESDLLQSIKEVKKNINAEESNKESDENRVNVNALNHVTRQRRELQSSLIKTIGRKSTRINPRIVREIVSKITGINQERLHGRNVELLSNFEANLRAQVIGQNEALAAIVSNVKRSILGFRSSQKAMGSFVFLGPSGVGKTYTARQLAMQLYGTEDAFTRFDMSDYSESNSITRLIGAPPGYVGFEDSGVLVKLVRQRPRQVLLFDEIEKAHPRVYDIFLQVLEEGTLQGQRGEHANFRHCIIIFTSNVGSREIAQTQSVGFSSHTGEDRNIRGTVIQELKKQFRPELINRFNDIIVFNMFQKEQVMQIIDILLKSFVQDLKKHKIDMHVHGTARKLLHDKYYVPEYGARSIVKGIHVAEDSVADALLKNTFSEGDAVLLNTENGKFAVQKSSIAKSSKALLLKREKQYKKSKSFSDAGV